MRTNIEIDDDTVAEAMKLSGAKTKREVVQKGLETLIRLGRQREIAKYRGKLHWEGDLEAMRRDR